jgi:nucleotide-binding universal stress UspA family protein
MMKILLAIDDSKFSEAATQAVLEQARPQDTEVRVLSVIQLAMDLTAGGAAGYYAKIDAALQEETNRSEALVAKTAELLRSKGFNVTSSAEGGDPRYKILDVAAEWHADLIVLGSHGRSGLNRLLMGSVSDAIMRHAPCSVEIIRSALQTNQRRNRPDLDTRKSADIRPVHARLNPESTAAPNVKQWLKSPISIAAVDIQVAKAGRTKQTSFSGVDPCLGRGSRLHFAKYRAFTTRGSGSALSYHVGFVAVLKIEPHPESQSRLNRDVHSKFDMRRM